MLGILKVEIILMLLLGITVFSCTPRSNNNSSNQKSNIKEVAPGKTRLDIVNEMSYRALSVPSDLDSILLQEAHSIWNFISDYDLSKAQLLKVNNTNDISVVNPSLPTIIDLRNKSFELWKTKDFVLTALVYRSSSIDAVTGEENAFFVIEIEHEKLTGTYYIFIPSNKIWDVSKIETNYVDRN